MVHVLIGFGIVILSLLPLGWALQVRSYRRRRGGMALLSVGVGVGGFLLMLLGWRVAFL